MSDAQLPNLTALRRGELPNAAGRRSAGCCTATSPPLASRCCSTSQWKAGKTTLATILIDRMRAGGELAGRAVAAGKAVIVSEEDQG